MMKRSIGAIAAGTLLAVGVASCGGSDSGGNTEPATLVLRGGKVMTMDAKRSTATAVAVRGKLIVAVGNDASMTPYIGSGTQVIELGGHTLLPGFIDAHIHPVVGALDLNQCSMAGEALAVADVVARARACVAADTGAAPDAWIQIVGVNPAGFVATASDLDAISTTRPVVLNGIDKHTMWLNHQALKVAGITAATPDPAGGQIERDAHGDPTGFLKDSALEIVDAVIPPLPLATQVSLTQQALDMVRSKGITTLQDARATEQVLEVYAALESAGQLNLRVRADLASSIADDEAEYQRLIGLRTRFAGDRLIRADAVKIFADGVIEYPTQTAALTHPYLDGNGQPTANSGGRYFTQDVLNRYVARLDKEGFSINVHAIGDYTAHALLDAFDYARGQNGLADRRHQISHLQLVDPADFPRFAGLGVYANMQLFWAQADVYSIEAVQPYISAENHRYMYPAKSLENAGAAIVGGSDWPVDAAPDDPMPNQPLSALQTGVTRKNLNPADTEYYGQVLHAEERVSRDDMLAAYTINAAKALKQDATTGSIEVGKLADLAVLDGDLDSVADERIDTLHVQTTVFDGGIVYQRSEASGSNERQFAAALRAKGGDTPHRSHAACGDNAATARSPH